MSVPAAEEAAAAAAAIAAADGVGERVRRPPHRLVAAAPFRGD